MSLYNVRPWENSVIPGRTIGWFEITWLSEMVIDRMKLSQLSIQYTVWLRYSRLIGPMQPRTRPSRMIMWSSPVTETRSMVAFSLSVQYNHLYK